MWDEITFSSPSLGMDKYVHLTLYWASLAFVRGIHRPPVNFPHKAPVTRKIFPFGDVIMEMCRNRHSQFRFHSAPLSYDREYVFCRYCDSLIIHVHPVYICKISSNERLCNNFWNSKSLKLDFVWDIRKRLSEGHRNLGFTNLSLSYLILLKILPGWDPHRSVLWYN